MRGAPGGDDDSLRRMRRAFDAARDPRTQADGMAYLLAYRSSAEDSGATLGQRHAFALAKVADMRAWRCEQGLSQFPIRLLSVWNEQGGGGASGRMHYVCADFDAFVRISESMTREDESFRFLRLRGYQRFVSLYEAFGYSLAPRAAEAVKRRVERERTRFFLGSIEQIRREDAEHKARARRFGAACLPSLLLECVFARSREDAWYSDNYDKAPQLLHPRYEKKVERLVLQTKPLLLTFEELSRLPDCILRLLKEEWGVRVFQEEQSLSKLETLLRHRFLDPRIAAGIEVCLLRRDAQPPSS